jgi:PAS domain S-box-containing protein
MQERQPDEAEHKNEELYGAVLRSAMDGFWMVDINGRFLEVNETYCRMNGYSEEELLSMYISDVEDLESSDDTAAHMQKIIAQGEDRFESRHRRKDGSIFDVEVSVQYVHSKGGHFVAFLRDITERKRTEEAFRTSEERLSLALQAAEQGIYDLDLTTGEAVVTPEYALMLGYDPDEFHETNAKWIERLHPDDRDNVASIYRAYVKGEIPEYKVEFRQKTKDGNWKWILSLGKIMKRDTDGHPLRMTGTHTDITERKRAEAEIADRSALLQQIMDTASVTICLLDKTGRITHANRRMAEMFGRTLEELLGSEYAELVHLSERETAQKNMLALLANKIPSVDLERLYCRKDGAPFWGHLACRRFHDVHGNELGLIGVITDISVLKQAEEVLRENQARLDLALQSAHMGVWHWEIKENRRYFDGRTCQLQGIDSAMFTGTADEFFRVVHPEDREKIKAALARTIEQGTLYESTYRVVWPEGNVRYVAARGKLIRDDKGQPERINGILWDVTDQRLLEQELIKTQKLESIGTLAGGIAHDFNNLLQGIFGYISIAKLTFDQKEKSLAMLAQAEKALHQAVNLTSQLLTFSKGGKPVKKVFDLRQVIENSAAFALSGSNNTYEIITDEALRAVEADEGQIGQVIQNIVLNADQSMPLGGVIRISVRNTTASAVAPLEGLQGDLVEISIRDQGTGIPAEHLTRIFDPYFTTKEKGSGLGLATSYSIIRNHGGIINVVSEPGKGTTFSVYLPASDSEKTISEAPAVSSVVRKGTILVMDDEDLIRNSVGELIMALGHDVDLAENGEAAIEQYQTAMKAGTPYDIVILDLTVRGGLGGRETIERLLAIDSGVRAIVSSGYSGDAVLSDYHKYGFKTRLTKPYKLGELRDALNALLTLIKN